MTIRDVERGIRGVHEQCPTEELGQTATALDAQKPFNCNELEAPGFASWPDFPVLLTPNPRAADQHVQNGQGPSGNWLQLNPPPQEVASRAVEFETELFKGKLCLWLDGLPSTPQGLFAGKKRLSWFAFQGEFKCEVSIQEVMTGQELFRPLQALPATWFVENVLLRLGRSLCSSMQVGPLSSPSLLSPLLALAQVANASLPGQEPSLQDASEDLRLLDARLADSSGNPLTWNQRRAHFSKAAYCEGLSFKPGVVWTFHVWQHLIDLASYRLDLSVYSYNLVRHLAGQPLQIMVKHTPPGGNGGYLFNFQVWHQALAKDALEHAAEDQQPQEAVQAETAAPPMRPHTATVVPSTSSSSPSMPSPHTTTAPIQAQDVTSGFHAGDMRTCTTQDVTTATDSQPSISHAASTSGSQDTFSVTKSDTQLQGATSPAVDVTDDGALEVAALTQVDVTDDGALEESDEDVMNQRDGAVDVPTRALVRALSVKRNLAPTPPPAGLAMGLEDDEEDLDGDDTFASQLDGRLLQR